LRPSAIFRLLGPALLCAGVLICAAPASALSPGDPDPTFGSGGVASYALGQGPSASSELDAIALQPDGKMVVGGTATDSEGHPAFLVARLGTDGALDPSFGDGGKVLVQLGSGGSPMSSVDALAVQPDGKILAGGTSSNAPFLLARLTAGGGFDPLFGGEGVVALGHTELPGGDTVDPGSIAATALQPDGKILTGGVAGFDDCCGAGLVTRLDGTTGLPDPLFGTGGLTVLFKPTTAGRHASTGVNALALQPDGKVVVGGYGPDPADPSMSALMVTRLAGGGGVDDTLASGMFLNSPFSTDEGHGAEVKALAVEPSGRIVIGGYASGSAHPATPAVLAGLNGANGTLDPGFAGGSVVLAPIGSGASPSARALGMALQPSGNVVFGGTATDSASKNELLVGRLDGSNGSFDPTFGHDGKVLWQVAGPGGASEVRAVALQPDGKILAAGLLGSSVAVARLVGDTPPGDSSNTGGGGGGGGGGGSQLGPQNQVATISKLGINPAVFAAAPSGPSIAKTIGAQVSYENTQAATTMLTVLKPARGARYKGNCVKPSRRRHGKRCTRWVAVGRFPHADKVGLNSFHFTGRVYGRKLKPGRYRLRARPRFAGPAGAAIEVGFRIVK
jgi:uncharacterized delta-60 repeat protein